MSDTTTPAPAAADAPGAGTTPPDGTWARKARAAVTRYRVLAWATGTMLLLLCLELLLKYVFHAAGVGPDGHPRAVIGAWVAFAHGWLYVVYLVVVVDLWLRMRWGLGRLLTMVVAGVVPVMSFLLEHRVHAQALGRIESVEPS